MGQWFLSYKGIAIWIQKRRSFELLWRGWELGSIFEIIVAGVGLGCRKKEKKREEVIGREEKGRISLKLRKVRSFNGFADEMGEERKRKN